MVVHKNTTTGEVPTSIIVGNMCCYKCKTSLITVYQYDFHENLCTNISCGFIGASIFLLPLINTTETYDFSYCKG